MADSSLAEALLALPGGSLRRHLLDRFLEREAGAIPAGARVLDIGGVRGGRGSFDPGARGWRRVVLNLSSGARPDLFGDAACLPIRDGSFDAALAVELLEHLPEPEAVLAGARRVLRSGGVLLGAAPFLHPVHPHPLDLTRWTEQGLRRLLERAGFSAIRVEAHGGFHSVVLGFLKQAVAEARWRRRWLRWLIKRGVIALQGAAMRRDERSEDPFVRAYATGYGFVAVRP